MHTGKRGLFSLLMNVSADKNKYRREEGRKEGRKKRAGHMHAWEKHLVLTPVTFRKGAGDKRLSQVLETIHIYFNYIYTVKIVR